MLRGLLVAGVLVFGLAVGLKDRFKALLLYLWFALFRPQEWMWWDISSLRPSYILGLVLVVPCLFSGVFPDLTHPLAIGSLLFLGAALLAQFAAIDPATGWMWIDFLATLVLVCLLLVTLTNSRRRYVAVVCVIACSFGFHTAKAGLASLVGGGVRFFDGLGGAYTDNNGYAVGAVMIVFLLIAAAQNVNERIAAWVLWMAALLSVITVISTFSRGGFLGLIAATLAFLALQRRRFMSLIVLGTVVCLALLVVGLPEGYVDRLETIRTYEETNETSAISRPHFWSVAIDMASSNPFGIGLRNYEATYDRYDFGEGLYGHARSVHSSHFQVLAETGWIGATIYTCLFVSAFMRLLRVRARAAAPDVSPDERHFMFTMANGLLASMCAFLVGGAFIAMALNDLTWLTFALVASLDRLSARATATVSQRPAVLQAAS